MHIMLQITNDSFHKCIGCNNRSWFLGPFGTQERLRAALISAFSTALPSLLLENTERP
jgi:hypothetical protein